MTLMFWDQRAERQSLPLGATESFDFMVSFRGWWKLEYFERVSSLSLLPFCGLLLIVGYGT